MIIDFFSDGSINRAQGIKILQTLCPIISQRVLIQYNKDNAKKNGPENKEMLVKEQNRA